MDPSPTSNFKLSARTFLFVTYSVDEVPISKGIGEGTLRGGYEIYPVKPAYGPDWSPNYSIGRTISVKKSSDSMVPGKPFKMETVMLAEPTPEGIEIRCRLTAHHCWQAFQIGNRGTQLTSNQRLTVVGSSFSEFSSKDTAPPKWDISGTLNHGDPYGDKGTWTFTPKGNGEYEAVEKGFENSRGTAKVNGDRIYIDWVTTTAKDGKQRKGVSVIDLESNGAKGSGFWVSENGTGGIRTWTSTPAKPINSGGNPVSTDNAGLTVQVGEAIGHTGDVVEIPVHALKPAGLSNLNVVIEYDTSVAKVATKPKSGAALGKRLFEANYAEPGIVRVGFAGSGGIGEGEPIALIPFTLTGAPGSRTGLKVTVTTANNASDQAMTAATIDGALSVAHAEPPPSDQPKDQPEPPKYTALDALQALKMSVKLLDEDMKLDLDTDKRVTSNDARLILKKIVGSQ
jgi:hypothetical protein